MNRQPGHPFECTGNAGHAMPQRVVEKRLRQMLDEMSQRACEMKLQAWQDVKDQAAAAIQSTNEYCLVRPPGIFTIWTHLLYCFFRPPDSPHIFKTCSHLSLRLKHLFLAEIHQAERCQCFSSASTVLPSFARRFQAV